VSSHAPRSSSLDEPRVFGALLLDQQAVLKRVLGEETFTRAMARLSGTARVEYEELMTISTCSLTTARAIFVVCATETGVRPEDLQTKVVGLATERTFGTLWRFLLRLTSDEALITRTPLIYARIYDGGAMTARMVEPRRGELVMSGWRQVHDLDGHSLSRGVEKVLELAGRKNVVVTWTRRSGGALFDVRWA
jgi:hypothetical protein